MPSMIVGSNGNPGRTAWELPGNAGGGLHQDAAARLNGAVALNDAQWRPAGRPGDTPFRESHQ